MGHGNLNGSINRTVYVVTEAELSTETVSSFKLVAMVTMVTKT